MMGDRIKAAIDARRNNSFVIMARTDALSTEGIEGTLERAKRYQEWGADMIFPEALTTIDQYQYLKKQLNIPILANITEFGKTPLFTKEELKAAGVALILYPLSAFRAMSKAALSVYSTIIETGTQQDTVCNMQTRDELYKILNYYHYEEKTDN